MADSINVEQLVNMFYDSVSASSDSREKAERDRDFYDGKQWTSEEESALKKRGQAPIVINLCAPKVDYLLGVERKTRTDPKAFPRNPQVDEGAAEACTDALRYVVDNNDFDQIASDAFEQLIIEGIEAVSVEAKKKPNGIEITLDIDKFDRFFYDPHSRKRDYADANYTGKVKWADLEDAKRLNPDKAEELEQAAHDSAVDSGYDDKPSYKQWFSSDRQRVMLIEIYFKHGGVWYHSIFTQGVFIQGPKESAYLNEYQEPENPMICASAKIDRNGNRYGVLRNFIGPQQEINKRRSKFLHQLSVRQTTADQGAVSDVNAMKSELSKPDGHVETVPGLRFDILPTGDMSQGQFALYQDAVNHFNTVGANAALQGKAEGDNSGRALENMQNSGMFELGPFFDTHRAFKRRIYKAIWNRVRQFWNEEKWIRITDNEDNLQWVGLNQPVTRGEALLMEQTGLSLAEIKQQYGQQLKMADPMMSQVVETRNQVAEIDVDIILHDSPDVVTLQSEQYEQLVRLYTANPNGVPWPMVIQASNLRNKDELLDTYAPQEGQEESMQIAQALEMAEKQATVQEKQQKARKTGAEADQTELENQLLIAQPHAITSVAI